MVVVGPAGAQIPVCPLPDYHALPGDQSSAGPWVHEAVQINPGHSVVHPTNIY